MRVDPRFEEALAEEKERRKNKDVSESPGTTCYVAILERHGCSGKKAVMVPPGQSLDFDTDRATRRWLHEDLGSEWHLVEFIMIAT